MTEAPPPSAVASVVPRLVADLATLNNCEPLTASVEVALSVPAATLVTWRSAPPAPTDTTEAGAVAAALPPVRSNTPVLGAPVTDPAPSATSLALVATAPLPSDTPLALADTASGPIATLSLPVAFESAAAELALKYFALAPPLASAFSAVPTSV